MLLYTYISWAFYFWALKKFVTNLQYLQAYSYTHGPIFLQKCFFKLFIATQENGYGAGETYTRTRTRTRFLKTQPILIYNPFSSLIWVLNGADFPDFKWVRISLPSLNSTCLVACTILGLNFVFGLGEV